MENHYSKLVKASSPVEDKYMAIFELKQLASADAVEYLKKAFKILNELQDRSCLLLHEIAYSFGQLPLIFSDDLQSFLIGIINDDEQFDIVRHEAIEALANLCPNQNLELFEHYRDHHVNDENNIISNTCDLAISKIQSYSTLSNLYAQRYSQAREPAPPFTVEQMAESLQGLIQTDSLINYICLPTTSLFNKYRTLYYIRNNKNPEQIIEMTKLLLNQEMGALFKHEISFILGQIGTECPQEIIPILIQVSSDVASPSIVRHEAIAAFQTMHPNQEACREFLLKFINDPDQVVQETVQVSLKVSEYYGE